MSIINIPKIALYARFSSDNQRSESIDAQIRAMNQYCKQQHWQTVATYTDEARSATSDNRPQICQAPHPPPDDRRSSTGFRNHPQAVPYRKAPVSDKYGTWYPHQKIRSHTIFPQTP